MEEKSQNNLKKFLKENQKERYRFIDQWAEYVRTHSDQDWSAQQNIIINSCLRTASMTMEQYHAMKNIKGKETGKKRKETSSKRSSEVSQKSLTGTVIYTVRAQRPDRFSVTVHPD